MARTWHKAAVGLIGTALLIAGCTSSKNGTGTSGSSTQSSPAPSTQASSTGTSSSGTSSASSAGQSTPARTPTSPAHTTAAGPGGGPVPHGFTPTSVTFVSTQTGWALGTAPCSSAPCTSIVRTSDGGQHWVGIPAPRASLGRPDSPGSGDVSVLRFATESDGWAGVDKLYSTHDGGAHWTAQHLPAPGGQVSGIQTGGGHVFVTTTSCAPNSGSTCSGAHLFVSPIGSDSWSAVGAALTGTPGALTVYQDHWWLPTSAGIYYGQGSGYTGRLSNPCPRYGDQTQALTMAVADAQHLDGMCVSNGAGGSASYQLYGTTDGGQHWRTTGPSHREPSGLFGLADNGRGVLLAATASGASTILRTTDDGVTFGTAQLRAPAGGIAWADLGFTTADQAVVVLQGTALYLSRDAGRTFTPVSFGG